MNKITATISQSFDPENAEFLNDIPFSLDSNECGHIQDGEVHDYFFQDNKWLEEDIELKMTEVTDSDIIKTLDDKLSDYIKEMLAENLIALFPEIDKSGGISHHIHFNIKN